MIAPLSISVACRAPAPESPERIAAHLVPIAEARDAFCS
jgi:hypothetical protein